MTALSQTVLELDAGPSKGRVMAERIAAAVLSAFALVVIFASINLGLFKGTQPGPGLFPLVVSAILLLLGVLWFAFLPGLRAKPGPVLEVATVAVDTVGVTADEMPGSAAGETLEAAPAELDQTVTGEVLEADILLAESDDQSADSAELTPIDRAGALRITFTLLWSLLPILLMERIGFFFSMVPYVAVMIIVIARRKWWRVVLITAAAVFLLQIGTSYIGLALPDPLHIFSAIRFW
ncbi:MAG: tripartite tricarboxylate transporter TctB family protein [Propionibacteriaceae bacterium]|jgi:hypothetical protein|nr:tripartite tricarboxylate transporter TctB family protein [Propionibacteriaceae bacterium]